MGSRGQYIETDLEYLNKESSVNQRFERHFVSHKKSTITQLFYSCVVRTCVFWKEFERHFVSQIPDPLCRYSLYVGTLTDPVTITLVIRVGLFSTTLAICQSFYVLFRDGVCGIVPYPQLPMKINFAYVCPCFIKSRNTQDSPHNILQN